MKIYLAGPMDFVSKEEQTCWRDKASTLLNVLGVETLNPCRRPHDCGLNNKEIFNLDMQDVRDCDLMLVDNRPQLKSFGTPCEVFYMSYILKKPVIGWHGSEEPFGIFQDVLIDKQFPSVEEAIDHIVCFYKK